MPPRNRKRAQAEAQDNQPTQVADVPTPPEATSNGPRRLSRRVSASQDPLLTKENRAGNAKKRGLVDEMDEHTKPVEGVAKRLESVDENSASALRRLEEMEASIKNDIKRRRLQIEQSIVNGAHAGRSEPLVKLRSSASQSSDVIHLDHVLLTPEEEKGHDAETTKDDESEAGDELIETIKGANRPPAVNSDYLPLPWRGRLGYVSVLILRGGNSAQVLISG